MANIVRRDPFAFEDLFDDLFKGYLVRPMRYFSDMSDIQSIKLDLKEADKDYTVHAELPGVNKEDLHVTIDGHTVVVSAEVKKTSEQKEGEKVLRIERYYGKVYRSFTLPSEVDESGAKARFENGVLELTLPKKAATASKRLTIE